MPKNLNKRYFLNYSILIPYLGLNIFGLIMVYSSTSYMKMITGENSAKMVITQAIFFAVSLIAMVVIYKIRIDFLKSSRVNKVLLLFCLTLGVLTIICGATINGAKGWLRLGAFSIQPAEYFKFLIPIFLASEFSKRQKAIAQNQFAVFQKPLLVVLVAIVLVTLQHDLGNAVILTLITLFLLAVSGIPYRLTAFFASLLVGGGILGTFLVIYYRGKFIPQYVYARFQAFADPFAKDVLQNQGHQLANSYYAIFNGGFFGCGLGNSVEKKGYLPEAHTDFIFSIVIEELGAVAALIVLGTLIYLITRILLVGIRASRPFNSILALGIGSMMLIQLFINLGGVLGLIPSTGVTFPFISQGGNSILVLSIGIALVLNVSADESRHNLERYLR